MGIFLTAEWRHLVMLNYEIDPAVLRPLVPRGTELDAWNGRTTISMVGFMFQKTRVFGVPIPGHVNFEEVNLRFYVRRQTAEGIVRGVVFIKELVPRWAIAKVARAVYNENYQALPMGHRLLHHAAGPDQSHDMPIQLAYQWRHQGRWQGMEVTAREPAQPLAKGTEAEFITEHYWGYVTQRDGSTVAYQVEHPRWRVRRVDDYQFDCDVAALYGPAFVEPLRQTPASAFIAAGSPIVVHRGCRLPMDDGASVAVQPEAQPKRHARQSL